MKLFSNNDINTSRQFEFDFAKAICIVGMVFVHCFEEIPLTESGYDSSLYYIFVVVLDALFGAGIFMSCMGIGMSYTKNNTANCYIKRGISLFIISYILNFFRFVLPGCLYFFTDDTAETLKRIIGYFFYTDILQFAGLAFILFGLLKKFKLPNWGIAVIALLMSIIGSFARFMDVGNYLTNELLGLFIGTMDESVSIGYYSDFPLFNWFIIVVFGYFFGKLIRKCNNIEKFYAIFTPISSALVIIYMFIAIPNKLGMMSGDLLYYYQMTTLDSFLIMISAVFVFGLYHYIAKLLITPIKNYMTSLSMNLNKIYCIHWIFVGWLEEILWITYEEGLSTPLIILMALSIFILSSLIAEFINRKSKKSA